jgi:hypothetical protein
MNDTQAAATARLQAELRLGIEHWIGIAQQQADRIAELESQLAAAESPGSFSALVPTEAPPTDGDVFADCARLLADAEQHA